LKSRNIFYHVYIYNAMKTKNSIKYRVKKEKGKKEKLDFFFRSNYPTKVYTNKVDQG